MHDSNYKYDCEVLEERLAKAKKTIRALEDKLLAFKKEADIEEGIDVEKMAYLETKECPGCLFFQNCDAIRAMENDLTPRTYQVLVGDGGECLIKAMVDDVSDKQIGEYYLVRNFEE